MTRSRVLPLLLLTGCPGGGSDGNPATLWLSSDGQETRVKLIDHEPPPF